MAESDSPQKFKTSKLNLARKRIIGVDIQDLLKFNVEELGKNKYIEGTLYRSKEGMGNTFFPEYRVAFDSVNVIYAKKTMKGYNIMMDPTSSNFNAS